MPGTVSCTRGFAGPESRDYVRTRYERGIVGRGQATRLYRGPVPVSTGSRKSDRRPGDGGGQGRRDGAGRRYQALDAYSPQTRL